MTDSGDKRGGDRTPVGLLVRLSYGSVDEFVDRFATNLSRGGVFIRTRSPRPPGTQVAFELKLASGETVVKGLGTVLWSRAEDLHSNPPIAPGMGVQFNDLDEASRAIIERVMERRGAAPGVARPAPVAPRLERVPTPTRAPPPQIPAIPTLAPAPTLTPLIAATPPSSSPPPAQADLSSALRVEQLQAATPRLDVGLPAEPVKVTRPSRLVIGIDLGTTNSCAAIVKDGKPYVIPSREGHATVPSIVALNTRHRLVVGHNARGQALTNPRQTVFGGKRLVGRPYDSEVVQDLATRFPYEITSAEDGTAAVRLSNEVLTLEQVSALILREVKEVAQNHLGEEVNRAVITVPAYYNERQRAAVRNAGGLAGLQVERILNEPTAAALAFAYGRHVNQRVLVYDLGGGTFDASILELNDNVYEVVSTGGDTFLGGVDFDNRIVERLLQLYQEQVGAPFDGDRVALSRLVDAAERAKCALSERSEFPVQLPFLAMKDGKPVTLDVTLTRDDVARLVEPLVDRSLEVCREVLAAKGLAPADVSEVLLVGGQSRMPLVRQKVEAFFGRQASRAVHPDEAVAIGAALLAHSLGNSEGLVLIDVLPMSIAVGLPGGSVKKILERNTPLPARRQYGLSTTRDGQTEFELVVVQGESPRASECELLGTVKLAGLPAGPRGMVKISVTFELGAECLLTVTARELSTGRQVRTVLDTRERPSDVQRRLEESAPDAGPNLRTGKVRAVTDVPVARRGAGFWGRLFGRREG
ncbi:MAG TPA: TIGR02266 family protein [Anaeromyxobacteraceae bacterium]|nr:TIGR02266 family protein [Anaeromyxobacteraceae bacterium]